MTWREKLEEQVGAIEWDSELPVNPAEYRNVVIDIPVAMLPKFLPAAGCVNADVLAGRARGLIRLMGGSSAGGAGGAGFLAFSVRRCVSWNHFGVIRDGVMRFEELVDSRGDSPYACFDFDSIAETWRDRKSLA